MRTEQEQIEEIEKVLKDAVADYKHLKKKGVCYCYAETLIDHGYGDVSEYKAEIDRLKAENEKLTKVISSKVYDFIDNVKEIADAREAWEKQAKIDVLKELKTRYDYAIKNMGYPFDISQQIDELIKEVEQ